MHFDSILRMANLQVRGVPDDVHRALKAQAAHSGQSLNEFMLARMGELARVPPLPELTARLRRRPPYGGPSSAEVIRAARDTR